MTATKRKVYLARHGAREDHELHGVQGARERECFEPALSPAGLAQAEELAGFLRSRSIAGAFSSPYLRCLQTIEPFLRASGLRAQVEFGLMESMAEFTQPPRLRYPDDLPAAFSTDASYRSLCRPNFPETLSETYQRAGDTVRAIAARCAGNLLFVGHEYTVIAGTRALLGRTATELPLGCPNAGVFELEQREDGSWHLLANASVAHLSEPRRAFAGVEEEELRLWLGYQGLSSLDELA